MRSPPLAALLILVLPVAVLGAPEEAPTAAWLLAQVPKDPASYGTAVYSGAVFPLKGDRSRQVFTYERRVRPEGALQRSTSVTTDAGRVVLVESATHDGAYRLSEFTEDQFQLGQVGTVRVSGSTVAFRSVGPDGVKEASETDDLPVVVPPTLYGFLYRHWDALLAGETVKLRLAVISRLETVGFELTQVPSQDGRVRIQMRASARLIRLLVDPIYFTFTPAKELRSMEGRFSAKQRVGDAWEDLDAYVAYTSRSAFR